MEDNRYEQSQDEELIEENYEEQSSARSVKGYRVVIILLAVILAGLSVLYFNMARQQQLDYELLKVDRDSIQSNLSNLITEYDNLKFSNDTIAANLEKANEMMEQLKRERRWNYAKLKEYEKEVGTLRTVMKSYLRQIDSLNTLNKKLATENVSYRKEISSAKLRAEVAEERATELQNRVQQGAVLRARDIAIATLNAKGNVVTRVKQATTLRIDFVVSANELALSGQRMIYVRITSPDGYLLSSSAMPTFEYEGEMLGYSERREIDYENDDVPVSIFYRGSGFTAGTYRIELYTDGQLIGQGERAVK